MKFKKITFDSTAVLKSIKKGVPDKESASYIFKEDLQDKNIVYFFYKDDDCKYVGESEDCLWNRCIEHTPKHKNQPWFKECNTICIILLDSNMDTIAWQALESIFIVTLSRAGHILHNKKA
jgi:hypothetical protein